MIALVEGTARRKTPNEIALNILIAGLTIVFLVVTVTLRPMASYADSDVSVTVLIALLVSLIPTTIGALLSAIGIAGMDRLVQRNVLALSGRAVEAAGDVDTLLLDKTGTITLGNRQATEFIPVGRRRRARARRGGPALLAGRRDPRGALDRRARQGALRPARAGRGRARPRVHPLQRRDAHERRPDQRHLHPQGRGRRGGRPGSAARGGAAPAGLAGDRRRGRALGRHPAGGRPRRADARRHPPQGRRQGGHDPALHRAAPDGHPHGDDHRRQPPHGRGDRRRGGRRRLPRAGDARGQDDPDPRGAGQGPPGGDDRRRHQRRARPWPRPTSAWP